MLKLRSNTFFLLLLRATRKDVSSRPVWGEKSKGLTRASFFRDLIRVVHPTYSPKRSLTNYLSGFMNGTRPFSDTYYPFKSPIIKAEAYFSVSQDTALSAMTSLCLKYLDVKNESTMKLLIGGIIDAVLADKSFREPIFIGDRLISKREIKKEIYYELQKFLLIIWSHILMYHPDASEAKETYTAWTSDVGNRQPRRIITDIGAETARRIKYVVYPLPVML